MSQIPGSYLIIIDVKIDHNGYDLTNPFASLTFPKYEIGVHRFIGSAQLSFIIVVFVPDDPVRCNLPFYSCSGGFYVSTFPSSQDSGNWGNQQQKRSILLELVSPVVHVPHKTEHQARGEVCMKKKKHVYLGWMYVRTYCFGVLFV